MRPILIDDLLLAARALGPLAPDLSAPERARVLARWLDEAHVADRVRKRLGRAHPAWGNGGLGARALFEPLARPLYPDGRELAHLAEVIAAVRAWRHRSCAPSLPGHPLPKRPLHTPPSPLSEGKSLC